MADERRKKKHLSTLHTARLVGNLFILSGFVLVVFLTASKLLSLSALPIAPSESAENTVTAPESAETGTNLISLLQAYQGYFDNPMLYVVIALVFWAGYLLKTLAVLAETQLIEL